MGRPLLLKPPGGMTGLRVDPKGRHWIQIWVNGKPVEKLVGKRAMAERLIVKLKEEGRRAKLFPEERVAAEQNGLTVAHLFERYRPADEIANVDSDNNERLEGAWLKVLPDGLLWHELDIDMIAAQQAAWLREGKAPGTINRHTTRLHAVLALAVDARVIKYNPIAGYKRLREPSRRSRKLSREEEALLAPEMEANDWDMVLFALWSGFRQEEQFTCKVSFVDLSANEIRLPEVKTTQRQSPGRIIPMLPQLREVVERLLARAKAMGSEWLFPNRSASNHWLPGNFLKHWFRPALKRAGIVDLIWHDLRRTCATRLHVWLGWPMAAVQAYLGHGNSKTTDRYMAVAPSELHDLVAKAPKVT